MRIIESVLALSLTLMPVKELHDINYHHISNIPITHTDKPECVIETPVSLEDRIDQMLMVPVDYAIAHPEKNFGGVIYLGHHFKKYSIKDIIGINTELAMKSIIPLIALDEEGGYVRRLSKSDGFFEFCSGKIINFSLKYYNRLTVPSQESIYTSYKKSADKVQFIKDYEEFAFGLAETLRDAGFTMNLGPVFDRVPDPNSDKYIMAVQNRSFGPDVKIAKRLLNAYIHGFKSADMMHTAKHFPGLGSTRNDTHTQPVIVEKNLDQIKCADLNVYNGTIQRTPVLMLSHAEYDAFDPGVPATASAVIRNYLIHSMDYDGIILSDDITMGALDNYDNRWGDVASACDMILTTETRKISPKHINHMGNGRSMDVMSHIRDSIACLGKDEIDARFERIIVQKRQYGLVR